MKRLITLALAFAVTVTGISALLPVEARSLSGAYADQAALLAEIGLMDTVSESEAAQMAVTRGEFAQYLGSILQIEEVGVTDTRYFVDVPLDHWAVSAINRLTEMGVISIGADRKFRPGDKITENEALKMALSAAGYGEYAQVKGGYPAGFYQTAKELNMPVSGSDEPLMLSAAVELLYEILQVPVYIGQSYTGDVVGYGPSKETLLSLYYDMYAAEGVVTYAGGIALDGGSVEEENIIRVDGTREYRTELNLLNDAGRYISFVCKDSKSGLDEIVLVNTEKNQDKMIEFYKEDLIEYRSADNTLVYYSDAEREVQARLAKNAVVVKNGKLMDENTAGAFEFNKGSIRLINVDTDGSYDYVIIYAYENYVIESVDAASEVLYDALDPARKISMYGFDECYQSAIKWEIEKSKSQCFHGFVGPHIHFLLIPTQ